MIDHRAYKQIHGKRSNKVLTFVITWTQTPDLTVAKQLPNRRERVAAKNKAFASIKDEVVGKLKQHEKVVVRDLPGTGQAIVSAPSEVWREISPWVMNRPDLKLLTNDVVESVEI